MLVEMVYDIVSNACEICACSDASRTRVLLLPAGYLSFRVPDQRVNVARTCAFAEEQGSA